MTHSMLTLQVPKPADLSVVQPLRFGDVFVDEVTGWTHLCDGTCALQVSACAAKHMFAITC
jgi:hypothetical protein